MGGNALKQFTETRRVDASEYITICDEVLKLLNTPNINRTHVVRAYRTKESFGDLDVLYTTVNDCRMSATDVAALFPGTVGLIQNSDVVSVEYKNFQVDLIHCPAEEFEYSRAYFAWNDCGNLVGKIARQLGLKHGHSGLSLPLRNEHTLMHDLILTRDPAEAIAFLDLDYDRFEAGFDTLEEMFEWVMESHWFNSSAYALENVSHYGRVRDRKRSTYQAFLKYLETKNIPPLAAARDKTVYYPMILSAFPHARQKFEEVFQTHAISLLVREKFGGGMVRELTKLEGKELGAFVSHLKSLPAFSPGMLLALSQQTITSIVVDEFSNWTPT